MTDPTFITALATLITAFAALLKTIQNAKDISDTHNTLRVVDSHTNGQLQVLQQAVTDLRRVKATQSELDARPKSEAPIAP